MTSDQNAEKPPEMRRRCPYCGVLSTSATVPCWICLEQSAIQEGKPPSSPPRHCSPEKRDQIDDNGAWAVFGALAVLLIFALAFELPGVLILLLVLAAPALVRTIMAVSQRSDESAPASLPSFLVIFLNSLGVAAVVGLASFIGFFATCYVACLGIVSVCSMGLSSIEELMICGAIPGSVVGLVVAYMMFRLLGPGRGRT